MATGDIQITIAQITKTKGTDANDTAIIPVATFPATNTNVEFKIVQRVTAPGDAVIYDVFAIGLVA